MAINKERLQLWLDALRSGDYLQGAGSLRPSQDAYCCLGVLCDVYKRETGNGEFDVDRQGFFVGGEFDDTQPPPLVLDWIGNNYKDMFITLDEEAGLYKSIVSLNDGISCRKRSFAEIADILENEHLKETNQA